MVYCAKGEASHKESTWNTSGFLGSYLINHFFRVNCPEKRGFLSFEFKFCQLHHLGLYFLNREHCCHDLWDPFFPKFERFGFKARGLCDTWHRLLIFRKYSKDKKKRGLKTNLTLSLILRFNLRLGGYSIWSAIIHRTPCKKRNSGHEHLIASM
jgi:hypothetical protein